MPTAVSFGLPRRRDIARGSRSTGSPDGIVWVREVVCEQPVQHAPCLMVGISEVKKIAEPAPFVRTYMDVASNDDLRRNAKRREFPTAAPGAKRSLVHSRLERVSGKAGYLQLQYSSAASAEIAIALLALSDEVTE